MRHNFIASISPYQLSPWKKLPTADPQYWRPTRCVDTTQQNGAIAYKSVEMGGVRMHHPELLGGSDGLQCTSAS